MANLHKALIRTAFVARQQQTQEPFQSSKEHNPSSGCSCALLRVIKLMTNYTQSGVLFKTY